MKHSIHIISDERNKQKKQTSNNNQHVKAEYDMYAMVYDTNIISSTYPRQSVIFLARNGNKKQTRNKMPEVLVQGPPSAGAELRAS